MIDASMSKQKQDLCCDDERSVRIDKGVRS